MNISILVTTAISLGFIHTLFGPDHYIPFVAMAKAKSWSYSKTARVTLMCGLGHVLSSVLIGVIGILLGVGVSKLEWIESQRGTIAGWLFIAIGLGYLVWGVVQATRNKPHTHKYNGGKLHRHDHNPSDLDQSKSKKLLTPWMLFIVFVFGPCEVLIPLLMYPAAQHNTVGVFWVTLAFGVATLLTMLAVVMVSTFGISFLPLNKWQRYSTAIAGMSLLMCGISINFLGL